METVCQICGGDCNELMSVEDPDQGHLIVCPTCAEPYLHDDDGALTGEEGAVQEDAERWDGQS